MNLPTVEVANGAVIGSSPIWPDIDGTLIAEVDDGVHALVPVDAIEKVWWCGSSSQVRAVQSACCWKSKQEGCGWRFLVSAKEEG